MTDGSRPDQSNPTQQKRPAGIREVRLTARADSEEQAEALELEEEVRSRLNDQIVSFNDERWPMSWDGSPSGWLYRQRCRILHGRPDRFAHYRHTRCVRYFPRLAGTYCNEMKEKLLGVSHETLERYIAVSAETAAEMADGSRRLYGSDIASARPASPAPAAVRKNSP